MVAGLAGALVEVLAANGLARLFAGAMENLLL